MNTSKIFLKSLKADVQKAKNNESRIQAIDEQVKRLKKQIDDLLKERSKLAGVDRQELAVMLRDDGFKYREIADVLGVSRERAAELVKGHEYKKLRADRLQPNDVELSGVKPRTAYLLKRNGLVTVDDVRHFVSTNGTSALLEFSGAGIKTIDEIEEFILTEKEPVHD